MNTKSFPAALSAARMLGYIIICHLSLGCAIPKKGGLPSQEGVKSQTTSHHGKQKPYEVYLEGTFQERDIDNAEEVESAIRTCILKNRAQINYPPEARARSIGGRVQVEVTLNALGLLESIKVVEGIGYGCDEEAERFVRAVFTNCLVQVKYNDVPVRVRFMNPVTFRLE